MTAIRLSTVSVAKPWGRHMLGAAFPCVPADQEPIGEIWFADPPGESLPLMVKYLFTSERLSIQVHPDDAQAQARGFACGKEECWVVLDATPDATLGLGLTRSVSSGELRAAALDGSIEALMDWKPVKAGDIVYLPAGTVHAIGAGITLIEVQQNIDLTYRLYDYGRPRALHLDDGMAVSRPEPFSGFAQIVPLAPGRDVLTSGRKFVIERWSWAGKRSIALPADLDGWFIPMAGTGSLEGQAWASGECWHVRGQASLTLTKDASALFAYPLPQPLELFTDG